jgi:signal peptidase I
MKKVQSNSTGYGPDTVVKTVKKEKEWSFKEFIVFILITFAIVLPIRAYIAQPFIVSGESMDPTFATGQYLIVDQITYRLSEPDRGDVVVFRLPQDPSRFLIKRLIALPGETVKIDGEIIYVKKVGAEDFIQLNNDYVTHPKSTNLEETLEEDEYFVLGDNRANSLDSRFFGTIDRKFLVGRALVRLFPFNKINWMPGKFEI